MNKLLPFLVLFALPPVFAEEREEQAPASGTLIRRLAEFPEGRYVMVQSFDEEVRYTVEHPRQETSERKSRTWNRLDYDLQVVVVGDGETSRREARVVVRRVQIGLQGKNNLTYDSDGDPAEQPEVLRKQFSYLIGGKAVVDLAAFDEGEGFSGLTSVWDTFFEEHPESSGMAEANRRNFGDSRIDRMFLRGLPTVFGPDAGRAAGLTRDLTVGETFETELEILGIGREMAMSTHSVEVTAIEDGHVNLTATWAENGHNPKTDGGVMLMRGGDIKGNRELKFHLASGMLVGLLETVKRTDQTCGMDMIQRTRHATTVTGFSIEAAPVIDETTVAALQKRVEELESQCTPARGTPRSTVEKKFGEGRPITGHKTTRDGRPDSQMRQYEFCAEGILNVRYDDQWLVRWAHYSNPYSTNGLLPGTVKSLETLYFELTPRVAQLERILAEYQKR